jgi:hypothetical protein
MENTAKHALIENQIDPLITTREAAALLHCTVGNIRQLVYVRRLQPAKRIMQKRLLFRRSDVEKLLSDVPAFDDDN